MTVSIANTNLTNTFDYWRERTNELAYAMSTYALTTGSTAVGNAALNGTFVVGNSSVNAVINSTSLSITNSSVTFSIKAPTAGQISNTQYFLNANGSWVVQKPTSTSMYVAGPSAQFVDAFSMNDYSAAEYLISVVDNVANNFYSSKILVMHDKVNGYITEYAALTSNTSVGVFAVSTNTTHAILNFAPVSTNATVTFSRLVI